MELLVLLAPQDLRENVVFPDPLVVVETLVLLALQELLDLPATLVLKATSVPRETMVPKVALVTWVPWAPPVSKETVVPVDQLDLRVLLAPLV